MSEIAATLKKALKKLVAQRGHIERQVAALESAIASLGGKVVRRARAAGKAKAKTRRTRRKMNAAQKQEVSQRMKAYWAKRRKESGK